MKQSLNLALAMNAIAIVRGAPGGLRSHGGGREVSRVKAALLFVF